MLRNITNLILIATALATAIVLGVSQPSLGADVSVEEGDGTGDGWLDNVIIGATDGTDSSTESVSTDGNPTDNSSSGPSAPRDPMAGLGQSQEERYCGWTDPFGQLPANDPAWNGHSPSEGVLKWKSCAVLFPGAPGAPGNFEGRPVVYGFFPNGAPIAPPPIDPAILAQRAFRELAIPVPVVNAGPDPTKLAVNLWTWLWVNNNPGQLSVTVTAGAVSVTATASLASVTWTLGEPAAQSDTYQPGSPATITCQGAGTAPPASYDWKAQPPCGYKYHWRSLKERTGGTGTWPITATTTWTVTWQSNTGVTGGTTLNATTNDQFDIGEYRTVLVQGTGG